MCIRIREKGHLITMYPKVKGMPSFKSSLNLHIYYFKQCMTA